MRMNYKKILERLSEFKADPISLLAQAEEVYQACQIEGYITEKVAGREKIELTERMPAVAIQAINTKLMVIKWVTEQAELEQTTDTEALTINVVYATPKE